MNYDFDPANNGIGIDQSNHGDWTDIPKFAGIMLGDRADSAVNGDSPLTSASTAESNVSFDADTIQRTAYVRLALPDPYIDGERFYARAYVWDGRTKSS